MLAGCLRTSSSASQFVRLDYNLTLDTRSRDTVFIELFDDRPLTQANFLQYVNGDHYDGTFMHRLSREFRDARRRILSRIYQTSRRQCNISLDPNRWSRSRRQSGHANPTVMNEYGNTPLRSNSAARSQWRSAAAIPNSATNRVVRQPRQ